MIVKIMMMNKLIIARIVLGIFVLGLVVGCIVIPQFGGFMLMAVGVYILLWAAFVVSEDMSPT